MEEIKTTPFSFVYDIFFNKITDDLYLELTEEDTLKILEPLLMAAIQKFEFPRFDITNIDYEEKCFNSELTNEEINILSTYMIVEWLGQQLASIENVRMKYSGSDFKFTSQANHLAKVLSLKKDYEREGFHLQRLYKRRMKNDEGIMQSTIGPLLSERPMGRQGLDKWF